MPALVTISPVKVAVMPEFICMPLAAISSVSLTVPLLKPSMEVELLPQLRPSIENI